MLLTFFFQIYILNIFGAGDKLDIYYASNTIYFIIVGISTSAINFAFTPIFVDYFKNKKIQGLKEIASSLFNIIFLVFLLFAIIQSIFAENIVPIILPGFEAKEILITTSFFQVFAFVSIITILNALLRSLHYTFEKFYSTINYNIIGVLIQFGIVYFLYKQLGIYALIYAIIAKNIAEFVLLSISFIRYYRFKIFLTNNLRSAVNNIVPLIISSSFSKSNILVDRFFASTAASGSITLLQYGERIIRMLTQFINKGISLVSLRKFSIYNDEAENFEKLFYYINKIIIFISIPLLFAIAFFFDDTLNIIVFSDKLSQDDVTKLFLVIISLLGIFLGGNINSTLTNAFYAKKLTSLVSKTNVITQIFGIMLKISMFYLLGFWGLPIAFSITSLTVVFVLYYLYNKHISKLNFSLILKYGGKIILISLVAVSIPKLIGVAFIDSWIWKIILEWILFAILFSFFALKFEDDISSTIYKRLLSKLA